MNSKQNFEISTRGIGGIILVDGLGKAVDNLSACKVGDPELARLWADAETALNAIQLYLEEALGLEFFNEDGEVEL